MQGERRTIGSFPEVFNIRQGSTSRAAVTAPQTSLNDVLNPADCQLSDYMLSSNEPTCENVENLDVQRFHGLDAGDSSSRLNLQNQICDDREKVEQFWPPSFGPGSGTSLRLEERQFEPRTSAFHGSSNSHLGGNLLRVDPMQGCSSSHMTHNVNLNMGYLGNGANHVQDINAENRFSFKSHEMDMEQPTSAFASFDHAGPSSRYSGFMLDEDSSDSNSFGCLGSSCKRKALEGSSGHSSLGGSSSTLLDTENSMCRGNHFPTHPSVSTSSTNFPIFDPPVFQNPRTGKTFDAISSTRVPRSIGNSLRNFGRSVIGQHNETVPLNLSLSRTSGNSNFGPHRQVSRINPLNDSLELRLTAGGTASSGSVQNQSNAMNAANFRPFPWNGCNPMVGSSSNTTVPGERAVLEESNVRITRRNSSECSVFAPAAEMRNSGNDPGAWNLASGNISNSEGVPSTVWIGSSSNFNHFPAPSFIPHHNSLSHSPQRSSELTPWSLFPSFGSDSAVNNDHFSPFSASSSGSSRESILTGRANGHGHHQPYPRPSFLMERRGNDISSTTHSLRGLVADIEGRRRLISEIRQVLNAMRRFENLQAEDYMLFDALIYHGMPEMHDRHRDMRLDVDNMSYEELLALEERIGDVSTGLSEDTITMVMKRRKYGSVPTLSSPDVEPCCICQEEYADGEDIGSLDCGHDFHTECVKQWLMQKNLCPICKTTALSSG